MTENVENIRLVRIEEPLYFDYIALYLISFSGAGGGNHSLPCANFSQMFATQRTPRPIDGVLPDHSFDLAVLLGNCGSLNGLILVIPRRCCYLWSMQDGGHSHSTYAVRIFLPS